MRTFIQVFLDTLENRPWLIAGIVGFLLGLLLGLGKTARAAFPELVKIITGMLKDGKSDTYSTKRAVLLMSGCTMSWAVLILSHAAAGGNQTVVGAMWAVTVPLAGLGGYSYVQGKKAEAQMMAAGLAMGMATPPAPSAAPAAPAVPDPAATP